MKRRGALLVVAFLLGAICLQAQTAIPTTSLDRAGRTFRLDPSWPFVYLKFDRIGPGKQQADDEPSTRIWLYLVNNCRLPIIVRGGQKINGGAPGEVAIDNVVKLNPPVFTITSFPFPEPDQSPLSTEPSEPGHAARVKNSSQNPPATQSEIRPYDEAHMPVGYPSPDVMSTETIMPGQEVLFSVPVNFVNKKWHFEINFNFASEKAGESIPEESFFVDPSVRGQVEMTLSYGLHDLPTQDQGEVEKLDQELQMKDSKTSNSR